MSGFREKKTDERTYARTNGQTRLLRSQRPVGREIKNSYAFRSTIREQGRYSIEESMSVNTDINPAYPQSRHERTGPLRYQRTKFQIPKFLFKFSIFGQNQVNLRIARNRKFQLQLY